MTYEQWRPALAEAVDGRLYTIEYLDALVIEKRAFMWASEDAAIIAEIKMFPTGAKAIHCLVAAGSLEGVMHLAPIVEEWGRARGCIGALVEGRAGWAKALKGRGYRHYQTAVWKDF